MSNVVFNLTLFRAQFPAFANTGTYPDLLLEQYFSSACDYISPADYGYLNGASRLNALNMMVAHLAQLFTILGAGQTPGIVDSATIDKVSVSLVPPPEKDQFQWWLNLTPYGAMLLALLAVKGVGGLYRGGRPELGAFRKAGGYY